MLKVPSYRYFKDQRVTAYQDDTVWWKFYLIPDYVSIRRDANGDPVFLLIKYAFSDQDRAKNSSLPVGGGFMVFDVELTAAEEDTKKVTDVLQADVNDIWNQMKALAESGGKPVEGYTLDSWYYLNGHGDPSNPIHTTLGVSDLLLGLGAQAPQAPPGDAPPKVILDMPTWTDGTFSISAPQSTELVSHRVTDGKVSLVGNNVAAVNMDLTDAGATFMQKTLLNTDGTGASDLTPIQVTYNLKFWARVPPVHILVQADSRALYEGVKSVYHDYQDNDCSNDVMTHAETNMSMAVQSGLVKIQIDPGTLPLTSDFLQQLTTSATNFVFDQIKNNFFGQKQGPPPNQDDPTKDFVNSDNTIYYLKTDMEFTAIHIGYDETVAAMQEWPANPQGTLQTFFAGLSAEKMKQFVRTVDLEDPFFQTLGLTVSAFAPWDEHIDFIEASFRYDGQDDAGNPQEKVQAFTFTKSHTADTWDPRLLDGKREYQYQWRVGYSGHGTSDFSNWTTSTSPKLNLDIGDPGHILVKVLPGNVNWADVTSSVQVDIDYSDDSANVPDEGTTLVFTQSTGEQTYDRWIYVPQNKPLRYKTHFFLKTGQQVDDTDWHQSTVSPLVINEPSSVNKLQVNLFPVGDGWVNVQQAVIDLQYGDGTVADSASTTLQLKSLDEFRKWIVVLSNPSDQAFQYKYVASFKDGTPPLMQGWVHATGDQTIPIMVKAPPQVAVQVLPELVDFTVTPLVEVDLHYDDPDSGTHQADTLVFDSPDGKKPAPQSWGPFPVHDDTKKSYRYQLTYHPAQGTAAPQAEQTTTDDKLVLMALDVPRIAALVIPKALDFTTSPVVEVDVSYTDAGNDIDASETLVFTDMTAQSFVIPIASGGSKTYQLGVTYYLNDGKVVTRDPVSMDKTQVVIPRYIPTTAQG
jgi:hypothetical protein